MSKTGGKALGEILLAGLAAAPRRLETFEFADSMFEDREASDAFGGEDERPKHNQARR